MKLNRWTPLALIALLPLTAFGKAAYYGKAEMIRQADIIAVVEITEVKPVSVKSDVWTYSQAATVKVEQVLKGKLSDQEKLYGGEDFICAQVKYEPGRALVFLRREKKLVTGVNWHLGVRPICDERLEWFEDDRSLKLKWVSLDDALEDIRNQLAEEESAKDANMAVREKECQLMN